MPDYKEIWLSPDCEGHSYDGRTWSYNNEWPDGCKCGAMPSRYIRATHAAPELTWRGDALFTGGIKAGEYWKQRGEFGYYWRAWISTNGLGTDFSKFPTVDAAR